MCVLKAEGSLGAVDRSSTVFNLPSYTFPLALPCYLLPPPQCTCMLHLHKNLLFVFPFFILIFFSFLGKWKYFCFAFVGFVRRLNEGKYKSQTCNNRKCFSSLLLLSFSRFFFLWLVFICLLFVLCFCGWRWRSALFLITFRRTEALSLLVSQSLSLLAS